MPSRFTDARELMSDLLNRYEAGTASPVGYPDYPGFADVLAIDKFARELREAEAAGAVRIATGKGRNGDQIAHVRLEAAARMYAFLARRPIAELVDDVIEVWTIERFLGVLSVTVKPWRGRKDRSSGY